MFALLLRVFLLNWASFFLWEEKMVTHICPLVGKDQWKKGSERPEKGWLRLDCVAQNWPTGSDFANASQAEQADHDQQNSACYSADVMTCGRIKKWHREGRNHRVWSQLGLALKSHVTLGHSVLSYLRYQTGIRVSMSWVCAESQQPSGTHYLG